MQILGASKKHALARGQIGCVGEVATLNVARGCAGACVFCYARCYSGAPPAGQLMLYNELPQLLRRELDASQRKAPLPSFVVLSTATDGFLGGPAVQQVTRACLEILLNRSIGVSFATRGNIPEDTLAVLTRRAPLVQATVGLASLSEEYNRTWEPAAARPSERLFVVQRLLQSGIRVRVRIEPIIPLVNDHTEQVRELVSALVGLGLTEATVSFLPDARRLVLGNFQAQPIDERAVRFQHLPEKQRLGGLRRLQRIAREHGFRLSACHCQNPGLPAGRCPIVPPELKGPRGTQKELFGDDQA